jgi:hypothetical protein
VNAYPSEIQIQQHRKVEYRAFPGPHMADHAIKTERFRKKKVRLPAAQTTFSRERCYLPVEEVKMRLFVAQRFMCCRTSSKKNRGAPFGEKRAR